MKRNWIYIHIHTTVLSAQKGGGAFEKHSLDLYTHIERGFLLWVFFFSVSIEVVCKRALGSRRRLLFFPSFKLFWSIVHASLFFTRNA
jgi:hypothetical protein